MQATHPFPIVEAALRDISHDGNEPAYDKSTSDRDCAWRSTFDATDELAEIFTCKRLDETPHASGWLRTAVSAAMGMTFLVAPGPVQGGETSLSRVTNSHLLRRAEEASTAEDILQAPNLKQMVTIWHSGALPRTGSIASLVSLTSNVASEATSGWELTAGDSASSPIALARSELAILKEYPDGWNDPRSRGASQPSFAMADRFLSNLSRYEIIDVDPTIFSNGNAAVRVETKRGFVHVEFEEAGAWVAFGECDGEEFDFEADNVGDQLPEQIIRLLG